MRKFIKRVKKSVKEVWYTIELTSRLISKESGYKIPLWCCYIVMILMLPLSLFIGIIKIVKHGKQGFIKEYKESEKKLKGALKEEA